MILLYELRVYVVYLWACVLSCRADVLKDRACRLADTQHRLHDQIIAATKVGNTNPTLQAELTLVTMEVRKAEASWEYVETMASEAAERYEKLNGRTGRTVPALLSGVQAWLAAGVLTYFNPGWVSEACSWLNWLVQAGRGGA